MKLSPSLAQQKEGRGKQFVEEKKKQRVIMRAGNFKQTANLKEKFLKNGEIKI